MRRTNQKLVLIIVFLLAILIPFVLVQLFSSYSKSKTQENKHLVQIVSKPPTTAIAKKEWTYTLSIRNFDSSKLTVETQKPSWIKFNRDLLQLSGVVPENINSFDISIEIKDANDKTIDTQHFTVQVNKITPTPIPTKKPNLVLQLHPQTSSPPTQTNSSGEVLGASTQNYPNTAIFPFQGLILGAGLILIGIAIYKYKTDPYALNTYTVEIKKGKVTQ